MQNKGMTSAVTGLALGAIVGTAAYMMSDHASPGTKQVKKMKRSAERAMRNASVIMSSVSDLMR